MDDAFAQKITKEIIDFKMADRSTKPKGGHMTVAETTRRCKASDIKEGDIFTRHSFGKVVKRFHDNRFRVKNSEGMEWEIDAGILESEFSFADQHEVTETCSRTRIIEVLRSYPRTAMTVCFRKKLDPETVANQLQDANRSTDPVWLKAVKKALEGETRIMIGQHTNTFDAHSRLKFTEAGKGFRLIDTRTIEWLVVDQMKYVVK